MTITTTDAAADTLRAARFRDAHAVLNAAEVGDLPWPSSGRGYCRFILISAADQPGSPDIAAEAMDYLASELGVTFAEQPPRPGQPRWAVYAGTMASGLVVEIHAWVNRAGAGPDEDAAGHAERRRDEIGQQAADAHAAITGRKVA